MVLGAFKLVILKKMFKDYLCSDPFLVEKEGKFSVPKAGEQKRMGSNVYRRTTEDNVSTGAWRPARDFRKQIEVTDEERVENLYSRVFECTLEEGDLKGLTQDEISERLAQGYIPAGMDFNSFLEMIESAGLVEEDF
ncbi:MAG: hypothetical protein AB9915_01795 [Candidatus Dojkabacteria bacterium]